LFIDAYHGEQFEIVYKLQSICISKFLTKFPRTSDPRSDLLMYKINPLKLLPLLIPFSIPLFKFMEADVIPACHT